jgi:hypothetical protein
MSSSTVFSCTPKPSSSRSPTLRATPSSSDIKTSSPASPLPEPTASPSPSRTAARITDAWPSVSSCDPYSLIHLPICPSAHSFPRLPLCNLNYGQASSKINCAIRIYLEIDKSRTGGSLFMNLISSSAVSINGSTLISQLFRIQDGEWRFITSP